MGRWTISEAVWPLQELGFLWWIQAITFYIQELLMSVMAFLQPPASKDAWVLFMHKGLVFCECPIHHRGCLCEQRPGTNAILHGCE